MLNNTVKKIFVLDRQSLQKKIKSNMFDILIKNGGKVYINYFGWGRVCIGELNIPRLNQVIILTLVDYYLDAAVVYIGANYRTFNKSNSFNVNVIPL